MMKFKIVLLSIFICSNCFCQDSKQVRKGADELIGFQKSENYTSYVKKVIPSVVELIGGEKEFIKNFKFTKDSWKLSGFVTKSIEFASQTPIVEKDETRQAILTYKAIYKLNDNIFEGKINLLAISNDSGSSWYYLDLESYDKAGIIEFVPEYLDNLPFPEAEAPVYVGPSK